MKSANRIIRLFGTIAFSGFFLSPSYAAMVAMGQASFVSSGTGPVFSGTLYAETFDAGGGTFTYTGAAVAATGSGYTTAMRFVLNPDSGGGTAQISDITLSAYQLGTGDTGTPAYSFGPGPTGGGTLGGATNPVYSLSGTSARFTFTPAISEGVNSVTSAAFYFTHPYLDLSATGTSAFALGDAMAFALGTTVASSVSANLNLLAPAAVPIPAAVWLFGSGLMGLLTFATRRKKTA